MSGMRARYPGFEYENFEDFCRRSPPTLEDQVWIPGTPYLEDSVSPETKPLETDKNIGKELKSLKTTVSKRKQSKPGVQVSKDMKPSNIQKKPVKQTAKEEKLHVKVEQNSKKELKPAKRESRKKKLDDKGIEEEKPPKEKTVKNKPKPRTPAAKKPKDTRKTPGKIIEEVLAKKLPSATKVTKIKVSTSQSL